MLNAIVVTAIASLFALLVLTLLWKPAWAWMQTDNSRDTEARVEFIKLMLQVGAAVAVLPSIVVSLATYRHEADKDRREAEQRTETENSAKFREAINMLKEQTLASTEAGLILLRVVNRFDPAQYTCASRSVLKSNLLELQAVQNGIDWADDTASLRYRRVFEAYIDTFSSAVGGIECDDGASAGVATAGQVSKRMDLSFLHIRGFDSPLVHESGFVFRGAVLKKADFSKRKLVGSVFDDADLSEATFVGADLSRASFRGANLSDASLVGARLEFADLEGANLEGARLDGSVTSCTNLRGADLSNANTSVDDVAWAKIYAETVLPAPICEHSDRKCIDKLTRHRDRALARFQQRPDNADDPANDRYRLAMQCDYP